jgi:hypothetical protein
MLGECQSLLLNLSVQAQFSYKWQQQPDPDKGYTVRGAHKLLTSHVSATMDDAENLIWHSQVPFKVSIFACVYYMTCYPQKQPGYSRHLISCSSLSFLDVERPSRRTHIHLLQYFWFSLGISSLICLFVFGLYGRREITNCSEAQQALPINC